MNMNLQPSIRPVALPSPQKMLAALFLAFDNAALAWQTGGNLPASPDSQVRMGEWLARQELRRRHPLSLVFPKNDRSKDYSEIDKEDNPEEFWKITDHKNPFPNMLRWENPHLTGKENPLSSYAKGDGGRADFLNGLLNNDDNHFFYYAAPEPWDPGMVASALMPEPNLYRREHLPSWIERIGLAIDPYDVDSVDEQKLEDSDSPNLQTAKEVMLEDEDFDLDEVYDDDDEDEEGEASDDTADPGASRERMLGMAGEGIMGTADGGPGSQISEDGTQVDFQDADNLIGQDGMDMIGDNSRDAGF